MRLKILINGYVEPTVPPKIPGNGAAARGGAMGVEKRGQGGREGCWFVAARKKW